MSKGAFEDCINLESINIPSSVTSIDFEAFNKCESLKHVYITDVAAWCAISFDKPNANPLFYAEHLYLNNQLAEKLIIPDGVTHISAYAFNGFKGLKSISIPDSMTKVGKDVFEGCENLEYKTVDGSHYLGNENNPFVILAFNDKTVTECIVRDGAKIIDRSAFIDCKSLKSIKIPNSVTEIGSSAFAECSSLESITLPQGLITIGSYAFCGCGNLTSVTFENTSGWWYSDDYAATSGINIPDTSLADPSTAATYLKSTYYKYYWKRG